MNRSLPSPPRRFLLTLIRFVCALSIALWVGGLAFFGIMAAPVLFHPERSGIPRAPDTAILAPQMVSAMLTRFGTLTTLCAVALLVGVLLDGALSRTFSTRIWRFQTVLCALCLTIGIFLNSVLLPQTRRDQAEILPLIARAERGEKLSAAQTQRRAAFDAGHTGYQRLASLNLYLLLAILFILLARGAEIGARSSEARSETVK